MTYDPRNREFLATVAAVREKIGKTLLGDDDLLVLLCDEISRTTTFGERNYSEGASCKICS
jgi:hypothetical protein